MPHRPAAAIFGCFFPIVTFHALMPAASSVAMIGAIFSSHYCGAKAAELQITKALRLELCGTGLRVSTVDPGMAETEFSMVRFKGDEAKAKGWTVESMKDDWGGVFPPQK